MSPRTERTDALNCLYFLREALADPSLIQIREDGAADEPAARAAYELAVAIGRCRVFGISPPEELDGSLPLRIALAAVSEMNRNVCREVRQAVLELSDRLSAAEAMEAEDVAGSLLAARQNLWAAVVALEEAYVAHAGNDPGSRRLTDALLFGRREVDLVDDEIKRYAVAFLPLVDTNLLDNWRRLLAREFSNILPWWLDERGLEQDIRRIVAHVDVEWLEPDLRRAAVDAASGPHVVDSSPIAMQTDYMTGESEKYEGKKMRKPIAAGDGASDGAVHANRTIRYLTAHLSEILRHGNSEIWFAVDPAGALAGHTYDGGVADGYASVSGPHRIPHIVDPSSMIEPDIRRLVEWMTIALQLKPSWAEQVCINFGWNW